MKNIWDSQIRKESPGEQPWGSVWIGSTASQCSECISLNIMILLDTENSDVHKGKKGRHEYLGTSGHNRWLQRPSHIVYAKDAHLRRGAHGLKIYC